MTASNKVQVHRHHDIRAAIYILLVHALIRAFFPHPQIEDDDSCRTYIYVVFMG